MAATEVSFCRNAGGLSARSVAYALAVVGAMFRWLIQQRYLLA
jgi:site-specific recombinase XerC